jgi:hypothetical protein
MGNYKFRFTITAGTVKSDFWSIVLPPPRLHDLHLPNLTYPSPRSIIMHIPKLDYPPRYAWPFLHAFELTVPPAGSPLQA